MPFTEETSVKQPQLDDDLLDSLLKESPTTFDITNRKVYAETGKIVRILAQTQLSLTWFGYCSDDRHGYVVRLRHEEHLPQPSAFGGEQKQHLHYRFVAGGGGGDAEPAASVDAGGASRGGAAA